MWNLNPWKPAFFVAVGILIWERLPQSGTTDFSDHDPGLSRFPSLHFFPKEIAGRSLSRAGDPQAHSANTGNSGGSSDSSSGHSSHSHPHTALFFLFNALIVGTIVLHLTTLPRFHGLQQTVCLFVLGLMYSLVQEGLGVKDDLGIFGESYNMWMDIDPHLLLFTMLPALLAGDAMTIDTTVARTCAKQCMFLAGPGVLFGAFVTAAFLYAYTHIVGVCWNFTLCLVCGSILAATDPVAVVGLLKELGASPTLTIQIQGESLLNDGTAIVLYTVAYNILGGKVYDATEIMIYLVLCVCCAMGLGIVLGFVFYFWIKAASNRLDHSAGMIQTALSICCAYWAFCIAEGALKWSGVLCTVSASLVLADRMWPQIVDKHALLHIWHMIEYLGNTIIFFLAGALTGSAMVKIDAIDYLHLMVIYIACMLIRATLLFGSRPLLNCLGSRGAGQHISVADVTVMTWGGLRGAVGLALAIQVSIDRANGEIGDEDGRRVLFYVGGIAALTLVINAPTCPSLVRYLGITRTPEARQGMLFRLHAQFQGVLEKGTKAEATIQSMQRLIKHIGHDIDTLVPAKNNAEMQPIHSHLILTSAAEICERFEEARQHYQESVKKGEMALLDMPRLPFAKDESKLLQFVREQNASPLMVKATYEAFLCFVQHHYWKQIEAGEFVDGTGQGEMLLNSVAYAFSGAGSHLSDLKFVMQKLVQSHDDNNIIDVRLQELLAEEDRFDDRCQRPSQLRHGSTMAARTMLSMSSGQSSQASLSGQGAHLLRASKVAMAFQRVPSILEASRKRQQASWLVLCLESSAFLVTISTVLVLNALFILVEQTQRKGDNYHHKAWLVLEIVFAIIFVGEFLVKIIGYRCMYFLDAWNVFDFILVGLSVFGIVMELMDTSSGDDKPVDDVSNEARLFRMNRLFRVLRIFRLFRLFKFAQIFQSKLNNEDISFELAEYLKAVTVCRAFTIAHTRAQLDLAKFFGKDGKFSNSEQMRCVLESQTEIYKAMTTAAAEAQTVCGNLLVTMKYHRDGIMVSGKLRHFIHEAHVKGVITAREAETLIHPLDKFVRTECREMKKTMGGRKGSDENLGSHAVAAALSAVMATQPDSGKMETIIDDSSVSAEAWMSARGPSTEATNGHLGETLSESRTSTKSSDSSIHAVKRAQAVEQTAVAGFSGSPALNGSSELKKDKSVSEDLTVSPV